MRMSFPGLTLAASLFVTILAGNSPASAESISPEPPEIELVYKGKVMEKRLMTKEEHVLYLKLTNRSKVMTELSEPMSNQGTNMGTVGTAMGALGLQIAAASMRGDEAETERLQHKMDQLSALMEAESVGMEEAGEALGAYGEEVGELAEALKAEIEKNSPDVKYTEIKVDNGKGSNTFYLDS